MKKISSMTDLFDKLNDLKMVFKYGEQVIPVIQNLIDFMKDTVPLLEDINQSILDSTNKIPKASNQISNVTNATELATTEILDIVDVIVNDIDKIETQIVEITSKADERNKIIKNLKLMLKDNNEALALIEKLEGTGIQGGILDLEVVESLKKIKDHAYNITLSLQVQDITSQQLAAVNHLIESVQDRLASLILDVQNAELSELNELGIEVPKNSTFDPNARYGDSADQQQFVDSIIDKETNKPSQEEIDKLFS